MLGQYDYDDVDEAFIMSYSVSMMIHVFIGNVFLLNYLVAILSTVYEYMMDEGEFEYKKMRYNFIEKYSVPMMNSWGYYELVIHPPPLNIFTFALLPFLIKGSFMRRGAECFSKFMFWAENFFYIIFFTFYEFVLCPVIFLRVIYNIFRLSTWWFFVPMFLFWVIVGPIYLIAMIFKDLFYFIKILCDYHDDEYMKNERNEEDFR